MIESNSSIEHDCTEWNIQIRCNQGDAIYDYCRICNHVNKFKYKSLWRRLSNLF